MKIQYMSDLHLECYQWRKLIDSFPVVGDVLVLAGDIISAPTSAFLERAEKVLGFFAEKWPYVVMVPGNHEFYGHNQDTIPLSLEKISRQHPNFYALTLDHPFAQIDGQVFVGGTLWFDQKPDTDQLDKFGLNDFRHIPDFESWVYEENRRTEALLRNCLAPDNIMVTHHLPSYRSVHPKYAASRLNRFFVHDLEDLIVERQPKLVIHGHTHERCDYLIGKTRVVCNPYGYPHESRHFDSAALIEI